MAPDGSASRPARVRKRPATARMARFRPGGHQARAPRRSRPPPNASARTAARYRPLAQLDISRPPMDALPRMRRRLHLAQQRIDLLRASAAAPTAPKPWHAMVEQTAARRSASSATAPFRRRLRRARSLMSPAMSACAEHSRHLAHQHGAGPEGLRARRPRPRQLGARWPRRARRFRHHPAPRSPGSAAPGAPRHRLASCAFMRS